MACRTAVDSFNSIVSVIGGPQERVRARYSWLQVFGDLKVKNHKNLNNIIFMITSQWQVWLLS